MNRYLISNPRFSGAAELLYIDGCLKAIDIINTDMTPETFKRFKSSVSVLEDNMQKQLGPETTIVAVDFQVTFAMFWEAYAKYPGNRVTVKVNKKRAEKTWSKLTKSKQVKS